MGDWFGRYPAEVAARQDAYLVSPALPGLSVKVRGGAALEVKLYRGSQGILAIPGRARGRTESWQKWSFPRTAPSQDAGPAGWKVIRKRRRIIRFQIAGRPVAAAAPRAAAEPRCAVELTEIDAGGQASWSLGFEATGPAGLLRGVLHDSAAVMFAHAPPAHADLGMSCCQSYAQWLSAPRDPTVMTHLRV